MKWWNVNLQNVNIMSGDWKDVPILENAFYFTWVDLHDLREMTLRERKEVLRIYNNQIERLLKIVS